MQYLPISDSMTLEELIDIVGPQNVDNILAVNNLNRAPNIGMQFNRVCKDALDIGVVNTNNIGDIPTVGDEDGSSTLPWQRKYTLLNSMSTDSDVFELAALMGEDDWVIYNNLGTFPGMLKIPESIILPDTSSASTLLGNDTPVSKVIHDTALNQLSTYPHTIDPSIFNEYSVAKPATLADLGLRVEQPMEWFNIPWGQISLYSSLSDKSIDIPVYPEVYEDGVAASYEQMPDMLYQYEPWQLYRSSSRNSNVFKFDMHRDMWTGDHRDGKCNELIRFCEANCYPEYNGSSVNTSLVTLYINGSPLIRGVLTNVDVTWDGPIGLDGWYLHCVLTLSIIAVSSIPLNYSTVASKGLIG